jgi:putative glutamine amidotransferase
VTAPAVGICAAVEQARWAVWDATATLLPISYSREVQRAGAIAWLMPPDRGVSGDPDNWLDRIDALLLAGGGDVVPASYGAEPDPRTGRTWPDRDDFEIALTRRAVKRGMPVLGICRGMQLLDVALGGSLDQHLPDRLGTDRHLRSPGEFGEHEVRLEAGSLAARSVGAETTLVKSHHHQGVDRLGESLVASGWAVPDDLVEAIELPGEAYALGVLWHPEEDEASRVIASLVEAARVKVEAS